MHACIYISSSDELYEVKKKFIYTCMCVWVSENTLKLIQSPNNFIFKVHHNKDHWIHGIRKVNSLDNTKHIKLPIISMMKRIHMNLII